MERLPKVMRSLEMEVKSEYVELEEEGQHSIKTEFKFEVNSDEYMELEWEGKVSPKKDLDSEVCFIDKESLEEDPASPIVTRPENSKRNSPPEPSMIIHTIDLEDDDDCPPHKIARTETTEDTVEFVKEIPFPAEFVYQHSVNVASELSSKNLSCFLSDFNTKTRPKGLRLR